MPYLVSLGFVASIQPRDWLERSSNDTQRYRGVYLHKDRVEEVDIVLCSVCSVCFFLVTIHDLIGAVLTVQHDP